MILKLITQIEPQAQAGSKLLEYGILGVMLLLCIGMIYFLLKSHKEERERLFNKIEDEVKENRRVIEKNSDSNRELTSAVIGLKTLLESIERNVRK